MPRLTAGSGGREAGESEVATSFGCLGMDSPASHASVWYRVRTAGRPQQDLSPVRHRIRSPIGADSVVVIWRGQGARIRAADAFRRCADWSIEMQ